MNPTIEDTINRIEELYATLTGSHLPHASGVSISHELDPIGHVDERLERLRSAVGQLASSTPPSAWRSAAGGWVPPVSAWRDETGLDLTLDVPGVSPEQLEIRLDDRTITVRGQRQAPWGAMQGPRMVEACEAPLGTFVRTYTVATRLDPEQISARLHAGVLHIRVANSQPGESSQIPIKP